MARPHIEFIHARCLPWQPAPFRPGATMKLLSEDTGTGALSAIVRYPPGWSAPAGALGVDEEFLVLDGELIHGDTRYGPDCYAFRPGGFPRQTLAPPVARRC